MQSPSPRQLRRPAKSNSRKLSDASTASSDCPSLPAAAECSSVGLLYLAALSQAGVCPSFLPPCVWRFARPLWTGFEPAAPESRSAFYPGLSSFPCVPHGPSLVFRRWAGGLVLVDGASGETEDPVGERGALLDAAAVALSRLAPSASSHLLVDAGTGKSHVVLCDVRRGFLEVLSWDGAVLESAWVCAALPMAAIHVYAVHSRRLFFSTGPDLHALDLDEPRAPRLLAPPLVGPAEHAAHHVRLTLAESTTRSNQHLTHCGPHTYLLRWGSLWVLHADSPHASPPSRVDLPGLSRAFIFAIAPTPSPHLLALLFKTMDQSGEAATVHLALADVQTPRVLCQRPLRGGMWYPTMSLAVDALCQTHVAMATSRGCVVSSFAPRWT